MVLGMAWEHAATIVKQHAVTRLDLYPQYEDVKKLESVARYKAAGGVSRRMQRREETRLLKGHVPELQEVATKHAVAIVDKVWEQVSRAYYIGWFNEAFGRPPEPQPQDAAALRNMWEKEDKQVARAAYDATMQALDDQLEKSKAAAEARAKADAEAMAKADEEARVKAEANEARAKADAEGPADAKEAVAGVAASSAGWGAWSEEVLGGAAGREARIAAMDAAALDPRIPAVDAAALSRSEAKRILKDWKKERALGELGAIQEEVDWEAWLGDDRDLARDSAGGQEAAAGAAASSDSDWTSWLKEQEAGDPQAEAGAAASTAPWWARAREEAAAWKDDAWGVQEAAATAVAPRGGWTDGWGKEAAAWRDDAWGAQEAAARAVAPSDTWTGGTGWWSGRTGWWSGGYEWGNAPNWSYWCSPW